MNLANLALPTQRWVGPGLLSLIVAGVAAGMLTYGVNVNQLLAIATVLGIATWCSMDRVQGTLAALVFYFVKPFMVRVSYSLDARYGMADAFDLLGIAPAVLLAALILWFAFVELSSGGRLVKSRTQILLAVFTAVALWSILNPHNSLIVGLGGFQRNVLPNMLILFSMAQLIRDGQGVQQLLRVLLLVGLVSCAYGLGQHALGLYPWERSWVQEVAFRESTTGWLTVGLRGVEFRLFSLFYSYMDFTFANALMFAVVLACKAEFRSGWRMARRAYLLLWPLVLVFTLERTAIVMTLLGGVIVAYLNADIRRRRRVVWGSILGLTLLFAGLQVGSSYLTSTGAAKWIRMAELANPLQAGSIGDRSRTEWPAVISIIRDNPLGVGIGYGSQSRANSVAARTGLQVKPHNELFQKALEMGLPGAVLFALLLLSVFRDSRRLNQQGNRWRTLGVGMMGGTVGFWLCALVNLPFSGSPGLLYWALAGSVIGLLHQRATEPAKPDSARGYGPDSSAAAV